MALKYLIRLGCQNQRLTVYTVSTLNCHLPLALDNRPANLCITTFSNGSQLFLCSSVMRHTVEAVKTQLAFISVTCSLVSSSFLRPVATRSLAVTSCLGGEGRGGEGKGGEGEERGGEGRGGEGRK